MSDANNPWTNSYELDGQIEMLLRDLERGPLTDDQVRRHCVGDINALLDAGTRDELERRMMSGAAGLLGLDLGAFSDAVGWWEQKRREVQASFDWSQVPQQLRQESEQRAKSVLAHAGGHGWIERDEAGLWRITQGGRAFLASGGFQMR